jgi:hypothetical protein
VIRAGLPPRGRLTGTIPRFNHHQGDQTHDRSHRILAHDQVPDLRD